MNKKIVLDLNLFGEKKRYSFEESSFTIGRSKNNQVVIKDGHFSRIHLKVKRDNDRLFIADNNTTNGTFVNGVKLPSGKYHEISSEDVIKFGNTKCLASFNIHKVLSKNPSTIEDEKDKQDHQVNENTKIINSIDDNDNTMVTLLEDLESDDNFDTDMDDDLSHDISQELSLDNFKNNDTAVDLDIDDIDLEENNESKVNVANEHVKIVEEEILDLASPQADLVTEEADEDLFALDEDALEEVYEDELEFAVDEIDIPETDSFEDFETPLEQENISVACAPLRDISHHTGLTPVESQKSFVASFNPQNFSYQRNTFNESVASIKPLEDNVTPLKVNKSEQIKNLTQMVQEQAAEISVDPEEVLKQIEQESELAEIHQLQFEQKKIEAKLISVKLIADAEKKAEAILKDAKKEHEKLVDSFESESKRINSELEDLRSLYSKETKDLEEKNLETQEYFEKKNKEIQDSYEEARSKLEEEISNLSEQKRHVELEYSSLKDLVEESNDKIISLKNEHDNIIKNFDERTQALEDKIKKLDTQAFKKQEDLEQLEQDYKKRLSVLDSEIESKNKMISILLEEKDALDKHIGELNQREEKKHKDYELLNQRIDDLYKDRERIEESLASQKGEIHHLESRIEGLKAEAENITQSIVEKQEEAIKAKEQLSQELVDYRNEIDRDKNSYLDDFNTLKERKNGEIDSLEKEIYSYQQRYEEKKRSLDQDFEEAKQEIENELLKRRESLEKELSEQRAAVDQEVDEYRQSLYEIADEDAKDINLEIKELKEKTAKEYDAFKKHRESEESRLKKFEESVLEKCKKIESQSIEKAKSLEEQVQEKCKQAELESINKKNTIISEASERAEQIIAQAKASEEKITVEAKVEAKNFVESARERLDKANDQAERTIDEAQKKALVIQETNLKDIQEKRNILNDESIALEKKIKDENERLNSLKVEYNDYKENLSLEKKKMKDQLEQEIADQKKRAQDIYEEKILKSENEASEIISKAKAEYESSKIAFNKKIAKEKEEGLKALEEEFKKKNDQFKEKYTNEKQLLAKLRATETENIKKMRLEAEDNLRQLKTQAISDIADSIEKLVVLELKTCHELDIDSNTSKQTAAKIRKIVRESFLDKNAKTQGLLDKLSPYGIGGKGQSKQFWIKIGAAAGVFLFFLITYLVFPSFYSSVGNSVASAVKVDKSAQEIYVDKIKEDRENRPTWDPKTDMKHRATYWSNVIYTKDFAKTWLSDDFQADWTLAVDNIFIKKLDLSESKVVSFVSEEFKLVRDLQDIRDKIRLETEDVRIQEMKDLEKERLEKIYKILGGKDVYEKFRAERAKYWNSKFR